MPEKDLTKLISRAIAGEAKAVEELMSKKTRQIIYISIKLLKNRQDGEDAAQEAMIRMYQHIHELKDPAAFNSWMYQVVTRTCFNYQRKLTRHEHEDLENIEEELTEMRRDFLPQDYIEDVDKRDFLLNVIDSLPDNYRVCLLLFYYENMTYQEIAATMDITVKSVDNILLRGKKKIKQQLEARFGEQTPLAAFQGAAVLPVLTTIFQQDADLQVLPETVAKIMAAAGAATTGMFGSTAGASISVSGTNALSGASASGSAAAGANLTSTAAGLGTSTKILAGLVAATTAVGGACLLVPQSEAGGYTEPLPITEEAEVPVILTLEDMIGAEAAERLQAYTAGNGEPHLWPTFLAELGTIALETARDGASQYTLHQLIKQDKQLLILERQSSANLEVTFRFTDGQEAPPTEWELLESVEGWR